jgi:uncharacterized protein with HEPN domain
MYDKLLAIETLKNIENSLREIVEWSCEISSVDDFTTSPNGMILLNALCMKILAVGEEIKGLDRRTGGELLKHYPSVEWKEIMGMRDIIAHRYFSLDAEVIFSVIKVDILPLLKVILQMTDDLKTDILSTSVV